MLLCTNDIIDAYDSQKNCTGQRQSLKNRLFTKSISSNLEKKPNGLISQTNGAILTSDGTE